MRVPIPTLLGRDRVFVGILDAFLLWRMAKQKPIGSTALRKLLQKIDQQLGPLIGCSMLERSIAREQTDPMIPGAWADGGRSWAADGFVWRLDDSGDAYYFPSVEPKQLDLITERG